MATKKKPPVDEVEISPAFKVDKTWSFRCNDERVTYEQYLTIQEDHKQWIKDQASKPKDEYVPPTKRKKKK